MKLSLVIPVKDLNDPKLKDLLKSIEEQDFPKEEMETLLITEGTSESAKAIGIRKAQGEVIGILASDNLLVGENFLSMMEFAAFDGASYPSHYYHDKRDDILNRYFSLIGGNDPLSFYMGKNDRGSYMNTPIRSWKNGTIGDNGFFIRKKLIEKTDLDNYYHIDNAIEALNKPPRVMWGAFIWHRTGGNLLSFFTKRYHYGLQHAFNKNRRWHLVDFRQPKDILRLLWFILATITLIPTTLLSIRGYLKIRDGAWFLHPIVCLMTLFTYALLLVHLGVNRMFQLLSAPMNAQKA